MYRRWRMDGEMMIQRNDENSMTNQLMKRDDTQQNESMNWFEDVNFLYMKISTKKTVTASKIDVKN